MSSPDFRKAPDKELYKWRDGNQGWSDISGGAKAELDRRQFWRKFWSFGLVGWIALGVSIVSLVISILKN
jgi:hypothetical protein